MIKSDRWIRRMAKEARIIEPFEPEWEGYVTLEFSNTTPLPAKIYANEGVAQVIFFESDEVCEVSYKDRGGKYQGQQGVTLPKI
jgi:dCTP deaminase